MTDTELIYSLGGPTVLAKRLGYTRTRVQMWASNGHIPADIKLAHPTLFMPGWVAPPKRVMRRKEK